MRGEAVRWGLCAAIVAAAHGLAWFALATSHPSVESDAGSPVVTLELSPVSEAPAPEEAQAAQPDSQPAPPSEPVAQAAPSPLPTPDPILPQVAAEPDPPPPSPIATPDVDSAPPPPPPPGPAPPPPPPVVDLPSRPPSPPPAAPSVAVAATAGTAAAPRVAPGREDITISATELRNWRRELVARIEQRKRFPAGAKGSFGVARIAFSINRGGHLTAIRLVASSGSRVLDQAALALIRNAQPFPSPPKGLDENALSFVAPIRYLSSSSR